MLADCEAGRIDIILTKSISRFALNTVDLLKTVRRLKELGIEVQFEKESIRSLYGDGELMLILLASFAQKESRFARNTVYSLTTIRQLKENGTEVYFEKEALYPSLSKKAWLLITYIKVIERIK